MTSEPGRSDVAIRVEDVAKRFRLEHDRAASLKGALLRGLRRGQVEEFWALDGVDLTVPRGATFALIGHNGSGKSTLLKCMARILRPDRGHIAIDGRMSALLELGAGFHPELSGRENVYLNASILGLSAAEVRRRFDDIVGFAGLERFIDTPVKNYSSGMYVRLGFSVAINVDPDVLLVDEVLAVGDESFQQKCLAKFAELRAAGRTVVVVSHAMGMVRSLCDQVAWLEGGRLRGVGGADEMVDAYLDHVRHGDDDRTDGGTTGAIEAVEVLGADGRPLAYGAVVEPGAPLTIRVQRRPDVAAPGITVALDLRRRDGILVARAVAPAGDGARQVDYHVPAVHLVPADYTVAASVVDAETGKLVAAGEGVGGFRVGRRDGAHGFGVVDLAGTWRWAEP